jgi:hypothetical protein
VSPQVDIQQKTKLEMTEVRYNKEKCPLKCSASLNQQPAQTKDPCSYSAMNPSNHRLVI